MKITAKTNKVTAVHIKLEHAEKDNPYVVYHRLSEAIALMIIKVVDQQKLATLEEKLDVLHLISDLSSTMAKNVLELNHDYYQKKETDKPF